MKRAICLAVMLLLLAAGLVAAQERRKLRVLFGLSLPEGTTAHHDLQYVPEAHKRQRLDLYVPPLAAGQDKLPLVVWIHGGAWRTGSKGRIDPALTLLEHGYAVAAIDYRLSQDAVFPAQIEDCKAAIRFLRANAEKYHLDPDRIGVWGASAGGQLAALLGTSGGVKELEGSQGDLEVSSSVQAVCDWFGPTDFSKFNDDHGPASPIVLLFGGPVDEKKDEAAAASAVTFVTSDDPPFLIMHGDRDRVVPLEQSEILADALKKADVEVTLVRVEGAGHGLIGDRSLPDRVEDVRKFFDKHLKGK